MLSFIAALALGPITYRIPNEAIPYKLDIKFNGYVPLFGLKDAQVELKVGLSVKGLAPEADGNPRAATDVSDLKIILNGSILPFGKDYVEKYFPNTVTLSPQGKVLKNNAPDIDLPIQLPGLDIKRFPDITFLAVEFPVTDIQVGQPWSYSRAFGASSVNYTITPTLISDDSVVMTIKMSQDYEQQEGDSNDVVKNPKDAAYDVKTHVEGTGTVEFDRHKGLIRKAHLDADAVGKVTKLDDQTQSARDLKTALDVELGS